MNNVKNILRFIITLAILVIGIFYLYHNRAQLMVLQNISIKSVGILFFLLGLFFYSTGFTFKIALEIFGIKISHFETLGLSILTSFTNYLAPGSLGSVVKAVYLKSTKQLDYTRYAALFALVTFIGFFVTGLMGGIVFLGMKRYITSPSIFLGISVGLILVGSVPFFYPLGNYKNFLKDGKSSQVITGNRFSRKIPKIIPWARMQEILFLAAEGFRQMRSRQVYLWMIAGTYFLQFFLSTLIFKLAFESINIYLSFSAALFLAVFTTAVNFVVITPNNIGIQETASGMLFKLLGFSFAQGVIGMGVIRVIHILITFTLIPLFIHVLFKNKELTFGKKINNE